MKVPAEAERHFIAGSTDLRWQAGDLRADLQQLDAWLARLAEECAGAPLRHTGLLPGHPLAMQAQDINRRLAERVPAWLRQRDDLQAAQAVADALDRKAIFLVFGKFNAGKSSLCNFIADRFVAHGQGVQYFRIEAGRVVTTGQRFREGATETTTALQGVFLGERLVLLDTPGLHSVTPENAELTQRFTDSADGVLWLTSSTSPGQVQELDELARELRRAKPLLPVVSRSDYLEEDEIDGEIVKLLRNKSPATRKLQQADVMARGRDKLSSMGVDENLLHSPVSVSVYAAHRQDNAAAAMREAGFDEFWPAFQAIVEPALDYKKRKFAEMVLHHAEERVLHDLYSEIIPRTDALLGSLRLQKSSMDERAGQLGRLVWRTVIPALPGIIDRHAAAGALPAVLHKTSVLLADTLERETREVFAGHETMVDGSAPRIELNGPAEYEFSMLNAALEKSIHAALQDSLINTKAGISQAFDSLESATQALQANIHQHRRDLVAITYRVRTPGKETRECSIDARQMP